MVANASPSRCEKIARAILKLLKEARPSPPWPPAATPDDAQSLDLPRRPWGSTTEERP